MVGWGRIFQKHKCSGGQGPPEEINIKGIFMFGFIKEKFKKVYTTVTKQLVALFSGKSLDEDFIKQLHDLLITADAGVKTTQAIIEKFRFMVQNADVQTLEQAKTALEGLLLEHLMLPSTQSQERSRVTLLVGVNGSGKTSFAAKYASLLKKNGKKVLLVAGDTFRAAATEQLDEWGRRIGVDVFIGRDEQDPASVVFDACKKFKEEGYDSLIVDTAGRLQTKVNLMKELEKIKKIIERQLPQESIDTWLAIDAMLGQNSLIQAEAFYQATKVNGIVLTKLDGTGKGGIVFAIVDKLKVPIVYVTFGEKAEDCKMFDAQEYVHGLFHE